MKLLTYKDIYFEYTYYLSDNGKRIFHGECKRFYNHKSGQVFEQCHCYHGREHGEYRRYNNNNIVVLKSYVINGVYEDWVELSAQEKLLFQIQHPGFRFIEE